MKKALVILIVMLVAMTAVFAGGAAEGAAPAAAAEEAWEPKQPITIMNHVKVGGAMDLYSRKWVEIAAKYTNATFVVDNNSGANGLTAGEWVLNQEADGYTVFALAPTYLDAVIQAELDCVEYVDGFEYIYNLMADPYCVLVPTSSEFKTFADLVNWAKAGNLITLAEPNYGAKYIDAVQVFGEVGVETKTITYEGAKAVFAALLGGQTVASVGHPGDTKKYDVRALVVGNPTKVVGLEDVPNYKELGYNEALDNISMWRGYAVKKGTPAGMIKWFQDLCDKVSADPEWIDYMTNGNLLTVLTDKTEAFTKTVVDEVESTIAALKAVEQISADYKYK